MIYMLDTNILISLIKNKPPSITTHINSLDSQTEPCMSFLTYAELLKGAERSNRKALLQDELQQLTRSIPVNYAVNVALCQHYATQFTRLKAAGTPIGAHDLWIACHVLSQNAMPVTHTVKAFKRINGLELGDWGL